MSFLTPDRVWKISMGALTLDINEKIIPDSARSPRDIAAHVPQGGRMKPGTLLGGNGKPRGITIHNTDEIAVPSGTTPAEQYARATWPNANMRGVVVHFYVWRRAIWQLLSLNEQGWHASDGTTRRASKRAGQTIGGNLDTIAIEVIGSHPQTEESAALLTAYLLRENGLDAATDLYTHNYFLGQAERIVPGASKNCPVFILPRWDDFQSQVRGYLKAAGGNTVSPDSGFKVGDSVLFTGGPIFVSSDAAQGSARAQALCTVTRTAMGNPRPYHLQSVTPGAVFGWADAANVKPAPPLCAECDKLYKELEQLRAGHKQLRGELGDLAAKWPK